MIEKLILPFYLRMRLAQAADAPLMLQWFSSARPELNRLPLPQTQLEMLLGQQFQLQQQGYASQYPQLQQWVIENQSGAIGQITLSPTDQGMHIIDWVLAEAWRGRGVGGSILAALQTYALAEQKNLSLSVDNYNHSAQQLYKRMGFLLVNCTATHQHLEWNPPAP